MTMPFDGEAYPHVSCHSTPIVAVGWSPYDIWAEGEMIKRFEVGLQEERPPLQPITDTKWEDAVAALQGGFDRETWKDGLCLYNGKWVNMDRLTDEELDAMSRGVFRGEED